MLTRRQLRIKVFQALYAYHADEDKNQSTALKNLTKGIEDIYTLFLYDLKAILEIHHQALEQIAKSKRKHLPTSEDINPNTRFVDNPVFSTLLNSANVTKHFADNHISWSEYREVFGKMFQNIRKEDDRYFSYLRAEEIDFKGHKSFVKYLYGKYIAQSETLHNLYEDMNLHWADDLEAAQMFVVKAIKNMASEDSGDFRLPDLFKDDEDEKFPKELFNKVVAYDAEFGDMIAQRASNWEADRIANADIILMKMAIAEFMHFSEIPVKVTMNEYIELSKMYSTPKSKQFINGVLDKIVGNLENENRLSKFGRGLL